MGKQLAQASAWLQQCADSRAAVAAMGLWAFAEATVWPIIPDAGLALLTAARPRRWPVLAAGAVTGSVTGGLAGWWATTLGWRWPLPLTTPRMLTAAQVWLAEGGAAGLVHQPLSGVPYKVFVAAAPEAGIEPLAFALATLRYRGVRFAVTAAITAVVAAVAWRLVPARSQAAVHVGASTLATVGVVVGLAVVVSSWS